MKTATKLGLLGTLYFSQGLPYGFFTQAMPVIMRQRGLSLTDIGLVSLLAAPWALKFLWAPALDRFYWPRFGRRRSWLVPLQLATAAVLAVLAALPAEGPMLPLVVAAFLLNLCAATQDIATDGLAVDLLAPTERGLGNGLQVAGYRVGMIVGGGALLMAYDQLGPRDTYLIMSALTVLATLPVLAAREPAPPTAPATPATTVHFFRRPDAARILLVTATYKAGDAFATGMLRPFLADAGLSLGEVGRLLGTAGFVAGLFGALAGGLLVNRVGRRRALLGFGLLQAASVAGYAYLALATPGRAELYVFCSVEHFTGGMATAALFTCMMDWSRPAQGGSDYTVQASAVVVCTLLASSLSGMSADALGYPLHFAVGALLALAALVPIVRFYPR